jgi:hypothetical protein
LKVLAELSATAARVDHRIPLSKERNTRVHALVSIRVLQELDQLVVGIGPVGGNRNIAHLDWAVWAEQGDLVLRENPWEAGGEIRTSEEVFSFNQDEEFQSESLDDRGFAEWFAVDTESAVSIED